MGYETRVKQAVSWQPSQGQPNKLHQALDGLVIKALSRVCSRKLSQPGGGEVVGGAVEPVEKKTEGAPESTQKGT